MRWRRALLIAACGPVGVALFLAAMRCPDTVERVYARGVYPFVQRALVAVASLSPVALGELVLLAAIGAVMVRVALGLIAWRRGRRRLRNLFVHGVAQALAAGGVLLLVLVLLWGLNHARAPLAVQLGLAPAPADRARLVAVVRKLAERAAAARPADLDATTFELPADWHERIADAYDVAASQWPVFAGPRPVIRGPWLSRVMTLCSTTGIYSPITGEANVNAHMPDLEQPFAALHEVAHLRGYAREDEANFIAWWIGSRSSEPWIAYSSELGAWRTAVNEAWRVDYLLAMQLEEEAPEPVKRDESVLRAFWAGRPQLATKVLSAISATTNDLYLKSAGHADGVRSYGRMVDLLIAALDG